MRKLLPALIIASSLSVLISPLYTPVYPVFAEETTASKKEAVKSLTREHRAAVASKTAEVKSRVHDRIEDKKEKAASRSALAKEKIQRFRDKKRAALAHKINERLPEINQKRTGIMSNHLEKLNEIISKLESKVNEAASSGKDTSAAQNAITEAKSAISAAESAVAEQSQKEYGITVTTETKISEDAKSARETLHTDLKSVHDLVVAARQSVAKAISTTVSTLGGHNGE